MIQPAINGDLYKELTEQNTNVFALDCVPRMLSRGQAFDTLSSQANIAGYRAVVEAAEAFPRFFAGQMTAAGKVPPAKVLVLGAGVAGLAAVQTAKNMGAIVRAFDVRPVCKEQVESMGATFLEVDIDEDGSGAGGYAKEMSDEYKAAQAKMMLEQAADVDVIIVSKYLRLCESLSRLCVCRRHSLEPVEFSYLCILCNSDHGSYSWKKSSYLGQRRNVGCNEGWICLRRFGRSKWRQCCSNQTR